MEKQNYKKIEKDELIKFTFNDSIIEAYKLKNYKRVYVSKNSHIKPKGLHKIIKNINIALKEFKIEDKNYKIIIFSYKDIMNALGTYKAINNVIYLNEIIADEYALKFEDIELGHVERHEILHFKQALIYRKKYGDIVPNNYEHYISYTKTLAKKYLDSLGINEDNVDEISTYASFMYAYQRYDEVEAEIKAKKGALCLRNFQKKCKN